MSKMSLKVALFIGLILVLWNAQGCIFFEGTHRFYSRTQAKEHFYRNSQAFQSLADDWVSRHENDSLVYRPWYMGEVRWNEASILQKDSRYVVREGRKPERHADSFAEAAKIAGADPSNLSGLLATFQRLNVAFVHFRKGLTEKHGDYLSIALQQAGADYGYIYVPNGQEGARILVDAASQERPDLIGMERVEKLAPHWYYFEGK